MKKEKEHAIEDNTLTNMKKKQATEYKKKWKKLVGIVKIHGL